MSTAQDLPGLFGDPAAPPAPVLRLVPLPELDFDDAVRSVRPRLHRYAVRRLGDSHEAEELVQEALLRAYTHREQLVTEEDLAAWTTVVTGRLVIDRLRVRGRSTTVADVPEGTRFGRDTADIVVARDEARTALDALDAMPARQASVLWAREVEGKTYDEIGLQFGMTEPAVRSVLTRARKALRKEYAARGGTAPVGGLAVLAPWIAGLSWAGRVRRAANRLTAPAVLGAAGIAMFGGLILSPFGNPLSGPRTTPFTPQQAIVTSSQHTTVTAPKAKTHGLLPLATAGTVAATSTASSTATTTSTTVSAPVKLPTVGCHSVGGSSKSSQDAVPPLSAGGLTIGTGGGQAQVGDASCSGIKASNSNGLSVGPQIPDNPLHLKTITIASDLIDCSTLPSNALLTCAPDTQQGATP